MRFKGFFGMIVLAVLSVLLLEKGRNLTDLAHTVGGHRIGITFLGLEVDDKVPARDIHSYAAGFMLTGLAVLASTLIMGFRLFSVNRINES
ncbi:hypothetical protein D1B31_05085 [Neobacillus notoginsengisoli]|uniref:Uncharacterized protein n=1 Tax=Neobacillus notoginsengisoli TaxID=1578198 RepID=A0A417YX07_9BACI|nr:hypothetical protein [Neobacillus notoginsengisoli]RHW42020.1 hypothetical protein D1B31_05085 [Neobacillus notoginsengisoli]